MTTGKIVDKGIQDANNMGAAMAPAAYDTIQAHFRDTGRRPSDYDLIVTGDLGSLGKEILLDLFHRDGIEFKIWRTAACSSTTPRPRTSTAAARAAAAPPAVLTGFLLNGMKQGRWRRLLFCGTGALLSPPPRSRGEHPVHLPRGGHLNGTVRGKTWKSFGNTPAPSLCGRALCLIGRLLVDKTKLTPARILVLYVVSGVVLGGLGSKVCGGVRRAGATVP